MSATENKIIGEIKTAKELLMCHHFKAIKWNQRLKVIEYFKSFKSIPEQILLKSFEAQKKERTLWFPKTFAIVFVGGSSVGKTSITRFFHEKQPECQILARDLPYMEKMVRILNVEPGFKELYSVLGMHIFYALMYNKNPVLVNDILNARNNAAALKESLKRISVPYYAKAAALSLEVTYDLVCQVKKGEAEVALIDSVIMGKEFQSLNEICPMNVVIYTTFEKIFEHVSRRNAAAIKEGNIRNWRPPLAVIWQYSSYFGAKKPEGGNECLGVLYKKTVIEMVMQLHSQDPCHLLPQYVSIEDFIQDLLNNFGFKTGEESIEIYSKHPSKMIIKTSELTPEAASDRLNSFVKFNNRTL